MSVGLSATVEHGTVSERLAVPERFRAKPKLRGAFCIVGVGLRDAPRCNRDQPGLNSAGEALRLSTAVPGRPYSVHCVWKVPGRSTRR
jgi:hypothetical protein